MRTPLSTLLPIFLGALHALSFAPDPLPAWLLPWVQIASFSALMLCLLRNPTWRRSAWLGWLFGLGNFATGLYWLFISLHTYGGLAAPLAVLAVLLFCAALALYYALAGGLAGWCLGLLMRDPFLSKDPSQPRPPAPLAPLLASAAVASSWALCEWLRGTLLTGFPWLSLGYAHVDGALRGWAPLLGVYGMGWLAAFFSISLALFWQAQIAQTRQRPCATQPTIQLDHRPAGLCLVLALLLLLGGSALRGVQWTQPHGEPLRVRLVQGNIPQSEKFEAHLVQQGMQRYMQLALAPVAANEPPLRTILMPETMMTLFQDSYPIEVWQDWQDVARAQNATLLLGAPLRQRAAQGQARDTNGSYTNSVLGLHAQSSLTALYAGTPELRYDKHHLVPFGEFTPFGLRWFVDALNIPLGDFNRGTLSPTPLSIADQHLALSICYEDLFGEELIHAVRPRGQDENGATILANVSNLGWFGHSWALRQHLQISRLRALETARPMLRAANTGISALITPDGKVQAQLPAHTHGVLDVSVQGRSGVTPYMRLAAFPLLFSVMLLAITFIRGYFPHLFKVKKQKVESRS